MQSPLTTVVTGASSGVGKETARALAAEGHRVILVCRSAERGRAAVEEIGAEAEGPLELETCDLSSLDQVRVLGMRLRGILPRIDALVDNAGVYLAERRVTADGFEETMAVNHLAHVLLTLLLEAPLTAARGRVVVVTSGAHVAGDLRRASLDDVLRGEVPYDGVRAYADSKLANLLFARELARRWKPAGVAVNALHPGTLATAIWDRNDDWISRLSRLLKPFMGKPARGGRAAARLAADPALRGVTGRFYRGRREARPSRQARDDALARELWEASVRALGAP